MYTDMCEVHAYVIVHYTNGMSILPRAHGACPTSPGVHACIQAFVCEHSTVYMCEYIVCMHTSEVSESKCDNMCVCIHVYVCKYV